MSMTSTDPQKSALSARATGALSNVRVMTQNPAVQRALPAVMIFGMIALGFVAWVFLSEPARTALYPGIAESEKARIVETLTGAGINAVIDNTTGNIEVASADYYTARMTLAAAGLPQSTPAGSDTISELPMGASRSVEATRLRQAQEYDLARSITEISNVQSARVHLALPERSAFLRDNKPPRASVFLQLAQGRSLDRGQVDAIVNLVSSSVAGMARSDVSVVDQMGRLLSRGSDDPDMVLSDRELEHRVQVETLYRTRIESLLAPVVGPENLSVQVTADVDFTRTETTQERLDPEGKVILSEQSSLTESTSAGAKGIPGVLSNRPPEAATPQDLNAGDNAATQSDTPMNRSSSRVRNYEISRTVTATQGQGAKITRLSAAILVHQPPVADDGPAPDLEDLRSLAQTAIGFDETRGDSVTVVARAFRPVTIEQGVSPMRGMTWLPDVLRQVAVVLGLAIVGLGIVKPLLDRVLVPAGQISAQAGGIGANAIEVGEGESLSELQRRLDTKKLEMAKNALGPEVSREEKFAVLRQLATDDPERIASVLHRMMDDEIDKVN